MALSKWTVVFRMSAPDYDEQLTTEGAMGWLEAAKWAADALLRLRGTRPMGVDVVKVEIIRQ